jgi:2-keto-3-deoxy-L-rhamnonate aldolase RhmA
MQPAAELKRRIHSGELTTGVLVTDHLWPQLVEIAQAAGLDYIIIDCEHQPHSAENIALTCMTGRLADFPVLLRPGQTSEAAVRAMLDLGPCGLLLPFVESAAQLDIVRDAAWLPPRGQRRPGGPANRWVREFTYDGFRSGVEDHLIVIPQIESPAALARADEIAGHEITTALGLGPFDLSAQLGICGAALDHPRMQTALSEWRAAADAANKPVWMIGNGAQLVELGFRFICLGEPSTLLTLALRRQLNELQKILK